MDNNNGQKSVQPDMTGMYGQQPVQPQAGGGETKKLKKPMTRGKLAALIGGGAAIVALVVCGVIFLPGLFKSDKEVVLDAIEETFSSYSQNEIDDILGRDALADAYQEKGGNTSFDISVNAGNGDDACLIGWNQKDAVDRKENKLSAEGAITIGGEDCVSYQVFQDKDTVSIGIPELIAGYLSFPADDPIGAIVNSPAGQSLGLDASALTGYSTNMFATGTEGGAALTSGYVDALETIWDTAEFKKQGRARITVNDETVTAQEYYVTWSKEDLQDACVSVIDGMSEMITSSEDTLDQMGMSADDYEYYMEQVKTMIPSLIKDDLRVKVYVKGKRAVKITCKDKINIMNLVKLEYDFWLDAGKDDLSGNLSFDLSGTSAGVKFETHDISGNTYGSVTVFAGDTEIGLDFTKDVVKSGDTVTTTVKLSASSYLSVDWKKTFNRADNTFENTINANIIGADTYVFNYKGAYKDINKGAAYTMAIDSFEFKVANQTLCNGSINTTIDTSNISLQQLDTSKKVYDIATATEDDLQTLGEESQKLMEAWVERLADNAQFVNLINMINDLFGTNSDLLDQVEEDIEEPVATDGDAGYENGLDDMTLENAYLQTFDDAYKYKIKSCIDGFTFNFASPEGYYVNFVSNNVSTIQYGIETAPSLDGALEEAYLDISSIDSYEVQDTQLNQMATVDGKDVLYNVQTYRAFSMDITDVTAVVEVEDGVYIYIQASIYKDYDSFTIEEVLQALSSQYYEKMN